MELSFEQSKQFLQYLIDLGLITSKEEGDIIEKVNKEQKRCLFLLADFLKRLTPSDCYDVALRMMQKWSQKEQKPPTNSHNCNLPLGKKSKKLPSKITEEEIEDTQIEMISDASYLASQKNNNIDFQKKTTQLINYGAQDQDDKNEGGLLENIQNANTSLPNTYYQNYYKPSFQVPAKIGDQNQRKKRMDRTFVNEQLDKVSKMINQKIKLNIKLSFQILKNYVLKQKLNNQNCLNTYNNQFNSCSANLNSTLNQQQSYTNVMNKNLSMQNINPSLVNTMNKSNSSQAINNNLYNYNSCGNLNQISELQNYNGENHQLNLGGFQKNKHQLLINTSNDHLQDLDSQSSCKNQQLQQNKYQVGYAKQKKQPDPIITSNNSSVSYQNNNNSSSNINNYGNSFQQSQKSDDNKVCTFRPRSNFISPTNTTAIQFNFSALNSANATPELFNRQQQFQHPEQIMEYSPSPTSTVNLQLKSGSFLQSSSQNHQFADHLRNFESSINSKNNNGYDFEEDSGFPSRVNLEQKQVFDKEEEELNKQLYRDLGFKDQKEGEYQQKDYNTMIPFGKSQDSNEVSQIGNEQKQQMNNNHKDDKYQKNSMNFQQKQLHYTSNVVQSNSQSNYLANIHNYSHISKNLDDSTSINFEASIRSFTKPINVQKLQSQQVQAIGNNQANSFLLQSQDIFSTRQYQNISRIGEQLGISQLNPFMSEMQYSNVKNYPEYNNENLGMMDQTYADKPIIFEDEQDQLLLSSTTENCSIQNKISSVQSSFQQNTISLDNPTQTLEKSSLPQLNINLNNNLIAQNKILQVQKNNPIYIEKEDSQLFTENDSQTTNAQQNCQNTIQSNLSNENNLNIKSSLKSGYQNEPFQNQLDKQIYQGSKEPNKIYEQIESQSQQQKQQQLQNYKFNQPQEMEQDIHPIYKTNKVALYSFDDEDQQDKPQEIEVNNQKEQDSQILNNQRLTSQIQISEKSRVIQQQSQEKQQFISSQNQINNQQTKNDEQDDFEQPEQALLLTIQPQKYEREKEFNYTSKTFFGGNSEVNKQQEQQEQTKLSKCKSTAGLKELYIDFNQNDRKSNDSQQRNTPKPTIASLPDHQGSRSGNSIHEKLYSLSKTKEQGQQYYEAIKLKQELKDCTFVPQLITKSKNNNSQKNSKSMLADTNNKENFSKSNINFTFENQENKHENSISKQPHKRLYNDSAIRKQVEIQKQELKQNKDTNECTFQPQLMLKTPKGNLIQNSQKEGLLSKESQKLSIFEKLYQDNQIKLIHQTLNQREKEVNELQQCTFKPIICEQSIRLSRSKSPRSVEQVQVNLKERQKDVQVERSNSLTITHQKKKQNEKEADLVQFYKKGSQQNIQIQQQNQNPIHKNRSYSSQLNTKKEVDQFNTNATTTNDNGQKQQKNQNLMIPYIDKQNKSARQHELVKKLMEDQPLKNSNSPKNINIQKKQSIPILKGCIDPNIDQFMRLPNKQSQDINTHFLPFNQSMPITPNLSSVTSTFDQMIQKKFKMQSFQDQNSLQASNVPHKITSQNQTYLLKGTQSVRQQKSISFNFNSQQEEQESAKFLDETKQNSGSPLIQNCKYFQDDIIDETKIDQLSALCQPKDFQI